MVTILLNGIVLFAILRGNVSIGGPETQFDVFPDRVKLRNVPVFSPDNVLFWVIVIPVLSLPLAIP